jgi:hypothetical protein
MMKILINSGPSDRGFHRLETFIKCPRSWAYKYLLHIKGNSSAPLVKGSLIHIGLAHFYARRREEQNERDPELYYTPEEAIRTAAPLFNELGAEWCGHCIDIVQRYCCAYSFENLDVMHVEEQFHATLQGKYPFTARWDLVMRDNGGKVWIFDHKTSFKIDRNTEATYILSGQMLMAHVMGAAIWGDAFGGVRLNFVCSGKPFTLRRINPPPAPQALADIVNTLCHAETQIETLKDTEPWKYPGSFSESICLSRYGPCEFTNLCQWGKATEVDGGT